MLKRLYIRSGQYFAGLLSSKLLSLTVFILFARVLLPENFGQFIFFITLLSIITFFADFGLNQWYQKEKGRTHSENLFAKTFAARFFTLILSIFLSALFLRLLPQFNLYLTILFLGTLIPEATLSIIDGFYLERGEALKLSLKNAIRAAVMLFGLYFIKDQLTIEAAVILYFIGTTASAAILFPADQAISQGKIIFSDIIKTLKSSSSYATLIFTSFFYARADHIIVKFMAGNAALGFYGAGYRYLESISMLPTALSHNLFPISARRKGITKNTLIKITAIMTVAGLMAGILTYFASDFLIVNILGSNYSPAVKILQIFSAVIFLFFLNSPLSTVIQSSNLLKKFLPFGVGNTVANIILNILLIPRLGPYGAAYAMLATEVTGLLVNIYFVRLIYKK